MTEGPPPFAAAMDQLDQMQRGAEVVALLGAALSSGLLRQLVEPCRPTSGTLPHDRLEHVLGLLEAYQIVVREEEGWQLSSAWLPVVAGQTPIDLEALLGAGRVRTAQVTQALDAAVDYWHLDDADRLLMARGMSFSPEPPAAVTMARGIVAGLPGVVDRLEAGGRLLELGCGVASRLTALLLAFPGATAVGVELAEDLAAFGQQRADRLGVGDRLTYVVTDATTYVPDGLFDCVNWSQFFFPASTRAGALATARAALRPGGWVTMPCGWDGTDFPAGSTEAQELAAERLVLGLWDVPLLSTQQVAAELEAAGFVDVFVERGPVVHFVRGRQP